MPICSKCGVEKSIDCFCKSRGKYIKDCKDCESKRSRLKYQKEKESKNKKARIKRAKILNEIKNKPCTDCKGIYPRPVLEYDHLPGTDKKGDVGHLVASIGIQKALEETKKCDLVCVNCHKVRTYQRQQNNKNIEKYKIFYEILNEFKNKPCIDCNEMFMPYVMCLIYKNGNGSARKITRNKVIKILLEELPKCDVICANCHRIRLYCKESL